MTNADITIRLTDEQIQRIVETALADVGRLKIETPTLTPEQQAVIDAAVRWCNDQNYPADVGLDRAVDALEASKAGQ